MEGKAETRTLFDFMVSETQKHLYQCVSEYLNSAFITEEEYIALYNKVALGIPDEPLLSSVDDIYTEKNDQDMLLSGASENRNTHPSLISSAS